MANVRLHHTSRERPVDGFRKNDLCCRPFPAIPFDTGEVVSAMVSPLAQFEFRGDRYLSQLVLISAQRLLRR